MSPRKLAETVDYTVQLEVFEGPLDLLLHLIRQQEIDIYDIPIATITDQYLRYLQMMKDLSITVAGEFLVMASTLIYIKSCLLLPQDPSAEGQEAVEDPRTELVHQLLEHEQFKRAAQMLHGKESMELAVWPRGQSGFESQEQEVISANIFDLVTAFHQIVERYKENIVLEVAHETVTIEEKIQEIRRLLTVQEELQFSFFVRHKLSRLHLVVTLFALLELARLREVRLFQKRTFEDIRISVC